MKTYCQQELYIETLRAELAAKDAEIARLQKELVAEKEKSK